MAVIAINVVWVLMDGYSFSDLSLEKEGGSGNEFGFVEENFVACV